MREPTLRPVALDLRWRTLFRIIAAVALVWCAVQLITLLLLVVVSVLLAVTFNPVVEWLAALRIPRWTGSALVVGAVVAISIGLGVFASTELSGQAHFVGGELHRSAEHFVERLPGPLQNQLRGDHPEGAVDAILGQAMVRFTRALADAVIMFALASILTLYLLIEGRRTYAWLLAFVPPARRPKVNQTAIECQRVIFGYVAGNVATSVFATIFVFVALSVLRVPAAMLLAILAGVCDFVPVLGFIVSAVPAFVLAFAVSDVAPWIVLALYLTYHTIENYFIAPWVYGDRLKLSNVVVVLAFAAGAELAGVVGALIALPITAAYPAIERIWLRDTVGEQVVKEHRAIEKQAS